MAAGYFQRLRDEGRTFFQKLSRPQQWLLGGSVVAVLVLLIGVTFWLQQPNWAILFSNLDPKDAGQIVAYLKDNKIPYQVQGSGGTIEVPASQVYELRVRMATQDMPREGGVRGFDIFDTEKMGMTNRVFDLNYQRALSGELARTIMSIDGVERARVHLNIPKKQIFTEMQDPASASVVLKLKPLVSLNPEQVKGISKLVAGAVPDLQPKNITITDGEGNILFDADTAGGNDSVARLNHDQLQIQHQTEREIKANVESLLGRVIGPEHVTVQVKALLDFDKEESVEKSYTPNNNAQEGDNTRVLRSEKTVTEKGKGTEAVPGGQPGTASNTNAGSGSYPQTDNNNQASYNREDTTRNYEVPEVQTTRVKNPGQIKRLSLSVALDSSAPALNAPEGLDANDPQVVNLRNLAAKAAGLDEKRGDTMAISALPFDNSAQEKEQAALRQQDQLEFWTRLFSYGLLGLVILLALIGGLVLLLRRRRRVEAEAVEESFLPEDLLPALEAPNDPLLQEASARRAYTVRSLSDMAKEDPARMARLLRVWIQEG